MNFDDFCVYVFFGSLLLLWLIHGYDKQREKARQHSMVALNAKAAEDEKEKAKLDLERARLERAKPST